MNIFNFRPSSAKLIERLKPRTIRRIGRAHAWLWRLTNGRLGDAFGTAPFMLLATKGRKTGQWRSTPVLYLDNGRDLLIVASFGGNDNHPVWYLNLLDCPEAEVTIKESRVRVVAQEISAEEKQRLWPRLVKLYPPFESYRRRTSRNIPVVRLSPLE